MTLITSRYTKNQGDQLIYPDHPDFYRILANPPPEPDKAKCFVVPAGQSVLVAVGDRDLDEYLEGGEYSQRLAEVGEIEDDLESDLLYLPDSICL